MRTTIAKTTLLLLAVSAASPAVSNTQGGSVTTPPSGNFFSIAGTPSTTQYITGGAPSIIPGATSPSGGAGALVPAGPIVTSVPVPAALPMLGLALAAFGGLSMRRRTRTAS